MRPKTCGECAQWLKTRSGRRKDDARVERVCVKGRRPVCKSMLADPDCFEPRPDVAPVPPVGEADICGDCQEWLCASPGRRLEDGESARVCRKGGRLVTRTTRADAFCFIRRRNDA